ncbi:hypothetical protein FACS1894211_07730 [Clostridia bacterium]|nr:hypothetical protein FACS1894211_07730 [Clostridia bacterium]
MERGYYEQAADEKGYFNFWSVTNNVVPAYFHTNAEIPRNLRKRFTPRARTQ